MAFTSPYWPGFCYNGAQTDGVERAQITEGVERVETDVAPITRT